MTRDLVRGEEGSRARKRMDTRRRYASDLSLSLLLIFTLIISPHPFSSFGVASSSRQNLQPNCSSACLVQNCNSLGIRYGKYCGVGWTGCPGEKPCDELDACCKVHDQCVENKGVMNVKCHEKFKKCIKKVLKSGKAGFSEECPYEIAVPTMTQGMDMAIMFSQYSNPAIMFSQYSNPDHEL